jgi:adenylate cyclase class 2
MSPARRHEIEIKLRVNDPAALRRKLRALRARRVGRVREWNVLFDTPRQRLRKHGKLLRLRLERPRGARRSPVRALLTYKGPGLAGPTSRHSAPSSARYKIREEIEAPVSDPARLTRVFAAIGLVPSFRYEKYRETYRVPGLAGLAVELDETPIGVFLELEGPPRLIDRASRLLGFAPRDYLVSSYAGIYYDHCRRHGLPPGDMVFSPSRAHP